MHGTSELYVELSRTMADIDAQIQALKNQCERTAKAFGGATMAWQELQNKDGDLVAAPILAARATCLAAMVQLKTAGKR